MRNENAASFSIKVRKMRLYGFSRCCNILSNKMTYPNIWDSIINQNTLGKNNLENFENF